MEWVQFRGRRAVQVETDQLRMTVTQEGGHIAELLHKDTAISPLWVPEWPSLEPSAYSPVRHPEYGGGPEATNELYISCIIGRVSNRLAITPVAGLFERLGVDPWANRTNRTTIGQ
jgi:hypothetical protein